MKKAISEKDLLLPALVCLSGKNGYMTVGELKRELRKRLTLHKADKVKVSRGRERFSNTVGNLISHRTLEKYAKYKKTEEGKVLLRINHKGKKFLYSQVLKNSIKVGA